MKTFERTHREWFYASSKYRSIVRSVRSQFDEMDYTLYWIPIDCAVYTNFKTLNEIFLIIKCISIIRGDYLNGEIIRGLLQWSRLMVM